MKILESICLLILVASNVHGEEKKPAPKPNSAVPEMTHRRDTPPDDSTGGTGDKPNGSYGGGRLSTEGCEKEKPKYQKDKEALKRRIERALAEREAKDPEAMKLPENERKAEREKKAAASVECNEMFLNASIYRCLELQVNKNAKTRLERVTEMKRCFLAEAEAAWKGSADWLIE